MMVTAIHSFIHSLSFIAVLAVIFGYTFFVYKLLNICWTLKKVQQKLMKKLINCDCGLG